MKGKKINTLNNEIISIQLVENMIQEIRNKTVILDSDLAALYQVTSKRLNEQVKRNIDRFPPDFLFQLTHNEFTSLQLHSGVTKHGGRRHLPFAFTEHGVVMAANLLNSKRAIDSSIFVVRTFIKIREFAVNYEDLAKKLSDIENKIAGQDKTIASVVIAIKRLIEKHQPITASKKREIGFTAEHD